ncbi:DUF4302 domain-containing protein [Adhaeribacter swui]|uniref:DUF4302 domain-containing protein n=1 Tax=Adhaeribacter swui TaxID=2086471 RepID=A0A7G7G6K7_9BACT|nr:DUF4302 domain-containing protein [Adhaeribacter swui]QNF32791.1 DUF4302 domain-containing protein [Adhaeribacter swui]
MKKIYLLGLLLLTLLSACQKDENDPAPGQRPDERLAKALADYKTQLTGAPYGWKATLTTGENRKYSFFLKFSENDRVSMSADVSSSSAGAPTESSYRLKAMQQPALIFDTYSPLHLLADPDPEVLFNLNGQEGTVGQGMFSDFEFTLDSVNAATIRLTGNMQQSKMLLVQATQEEFNAYTAGKLKTIIDETTAYSKANPFLFLPAANGNKLQVDINPTNRTFSLVSLENGNVQIISTTFTYTLRGLLFDPPLVLNNTAITELLWDSEQQVYYADINGTRVVVQSSPTAIIPLHNFVGATFNTVAVPPQALPGWSPDFTSAQQQIAAALLNGNYGLQLDYMLFLFNPQSRSMQLYVVIYQNNVQYFAIYPYTYTKTAAGVYKFTAQAPNGNGQAIAPDMAPILNHLNTESFTLDYFRDPTEGTLGQIKSLESPEFYFTGTLETLQ